jgi:hypothetical protein
MQTERSVSFVLRGAVGSDCDQGAGLISDPNPMLGLGKKKSLSCMHVPRPFIWRAVACAVWVPGFCLTPSRLYARVGR